jgi:hypothetical protein
MLKSVQRLDDERTSYAAVGDCVRSFDEEMRSLYLLSFLLTADHDQAERCVISAIGECGEGVVFRDWEHLWNRRMLFKHAIQMITPAPEDAVYISLSVVKHPVASAESNPFAKVLSLGAFERFVFVMSILEGVSDEECAILLNCSQRDVMMARVLALLRQSSTAAQSEEILQC